ncbi:MAG: hypothetical protein E6J89_01120 [Deltaproteobacteria bacterium]|nr:MAG: hypothetical protein E6J89_01120 [Deltaproteobacteria bacterium]
MPAHVYHFEDHWSVPFPIEKVWEVLSQPEDYPQWWRGVYLSAEPLEAEAQDAKRVAVVARGWLPYRLRFTIQTLTLQKPELIEFKATGDFVTDVSRWVLKSEGNRTSVTLEWNPRAEKLVVKLLSPILKPLFRWNHHWTMKRGQRQIVEYLRDGMRV